MIVRDVEAGGLVWVNRLFTERLGWTSEELAKKPLSDWIDAEEGASLDAALRAGHGTTRAGHLARGGEPIPLDWAISTEEHGMVALGVLAGEGISSPEEGPSASSSRDTLSQTLNSMALIIEGQNPGRLCSILLLDQERKRVSVGAGPSFPAEYNAAVEGLAIGSSVGSCGTAAFWGERVIVEDIQEEVLWRNLKQHAAMAGVAACWSQPIKARNGEVVGALALYNTIPSAPTALELHSLEMAAKMVSVAIERGRAEQTLRESEAGARYQARLLRAVTDVTTSFVDKNDWRTAASRLVQAAAEVTTSESGLLVLVEASDFEQVPDSGTSGSGHERVLQHGDVSIGSFEPFLEEISHSVRPVVRAELADESSAIARPGETSESLRNLLGSAIRVDGDVVAILCVGNAAKKYEDREVDAVSVLCRASSELFDAYRRQTREAALEEQLRQAAKMEAIGALAGGIAHDFNNLLTVVQGNAELALNSLPEGADTRVLLSRIIEASQASKELCNQMLAYAGRGTKAMQPIDLNSLVQELGSLQKTALSKKVRIDYQLSPEQPGIYGDRAQMNQVVLNLIANAAEALGDRDGEIVVTSTARTYGRRALDRMQGAHDLEPGRYACLTVSDTGCGMNAQTAEKIFDPFFSTKRTGHGLGLAAVRGIVRAHKGVIYLESEENRGTTFTVLLPVSDVSAACEKATASRFSERTGKAKVVLVVEDEPAVRDIQVQFLERAGYEVMSASDGQEGVELFQRSGDSIDCVLVDMSMPRLNGQETLSALRKLRGDLPVILTSGFTEDEMLDRSGANGFSAVVQKPFSGGALVQTINEVLADSR